MPIDQVLFSMTDNSGRCAIAFQGRSCKRIGDAWYPPRQGFPLHRAKTSVLARAFSRRADDKLDISVIPAPSPGSVSVLLMPHLAENSFAARCSSNRSLLKIRGEG